MALTEVQGGQRGLQAEHGEVDGAEHPEVVTLREVLKGVPQVEQMAEQAQATATKKMEEDKTRAEAEEVGDI